MLRTGVHPLGRIRLARQDHFSLKTFETLTRTNPGEPHHYNYLKLSAVTLAMSRSANVSNEDFVAVHCSIKHAYPGC